MGEKETPTEKPVRGILKKQTHKDPSHATHATQRPLQSVQSLHSLRQTGSQQTIHIPNRPAKKTVSFNMKLTIAAAVVREDIPPLGSPRATRRLSSPPPLHAKADAAKDSEQDLDSHEISPQGAAGDQIHQSNSQEAIATASGAHAAMESSEPMVKASEVRASRSISIDAPPVSVRARTDSLNRLSGSGSGDLQSPHSTSSSAHDRRQSTSAQRTHVVRTASGKIYDDKLSTIKESLAELPGREADFHQTPPFPIFSAVFFASKQAYVATSEANALVGPNAKTDKSQQKSATPKECDSAEKNNTEEQQETEETESAKKKLPDYIPTDLLPLEKIVLNNVVQWQKIECLYTSDLFICRPVTPLMKQEWEMNVSLRDEALSRHFVKSKYAHIELIDEHKDLDGDFPSALTKNEQPDLSLSDGEEQAHQTPHNLSNLVASDSPSGVNHNAEATNTHHQRRTPRSPTKHSSGTATPTSTTPHRLNPHTSRTARKFSPFVPRLSDLSSPLAQSPHANMSDSSPKSVRQRKSPQSPSRSPKRRQRTHRQHTTPHSHHAGRIRGNRTRHDAYAKTLHTAAISAADATSPMQYITSYTTHASTPHSTTPLATHSLSPSPSTSPSPSPSPSPSRTQSPTTPNTVASSFPTRSFSADRVTESNHSATSRSLDGVVMLQSPPHRRVQVKPALYKSIGPSSPMHGAALTTPKHHLPSPSPKRYLPQSPAHSAPATNSPLSRRSDALSSSPANGFNLPRLYHGSRKSQTVGNVQSPHSPVTQGVVRKGEPQHAKATTMMSTNADRQSFSPRTVADAGMEFEEIVQIPSDLKGSDKPRGSQNAWR